MASGEALVRARSVSVSLIMLCLVACSDTATTTGGDASRLGMSPRWQTRSPKS